METRRDIERQVVSALIKESIGAKYAISVHDGGEIVLSKSTDEKAIIAALFSVDEDTLIFHKDGVRVGTVSLVYGNDGWDVIADYSTSLECIMGEAVKVADSKQTALSKC